MSTTTVETSPRILPEEIHPRLGRHMLVDGYDLVLDLGRSRGAFLYDSLRGGEILDLFTCVSSCALGYNHPKLDTPEFRERILPAAINKPSNPDVYTEQMAQFVEAFARTLPAPLASHLFFIDGGALAVENALKTAFDWKVRKNLAAGRGEKGSQVIHFRQAFHGRSGYTLSLTNPADIRKTQYFPKFPWPRITNPKLSFPTTPEVLEQVIAAERQAIAEIEQALVENRDDIAALIIEPIQGEGGDNHFRGEFLRELRRLADEHDFLLIFDEIQTGFGMTGRWWSCEHFDVLPDIIAFGKKTQVCGIAVSNRIDDVESVFKVPSRINSTWGGNLVDMVRCTRFIEIIEEDGLLANAERVGRRLLDGLRRLEEVFPGKVTNSRGRGLFVAFDLPDQALVNKVLDTLLAQGTMALPSGVHSIRFRPALVLQPEEADEALRRVEKALLSVF
ncbi:MAG TPA: L-lysine 6-transaminase [Thermoanaerobaculia bacterium]|nr:L-lysine 6-transaminase [Thermoanaerobaculia bacterium]